MLYLCAGTVCVLLCSVCVLARTCECVLWVGRSCFFFLENCFVITRARGEELVIGLGEEPAASALKYGPRFSNAAATLKYCY